MAIEQVTASTCFEVEYDQIMTQLEEAQRIIQRYRAEEMRMHHQWDDLAALRGLIDAAWAEAHAQRFTVLQLLKTHHDASISAAAQKQIPKLVWALRQFSHKPYCEWADLAVSNPSVLEVGYWLKLTLLMTLDAILQYQIAEAEAQVSLIRNQFMKWELKEERTGFLKLFADWIKISSPPNTGAGNGASAVTPQTEVGDKGLRFAEQLVQQRMERLHPIKATAPTNIPSLLEMAAQSQSVVLVERIPDGDSDRDESLVKKYKPLTQPMPLKQVTLSSALIQQVLDKEFPWMHQVTDEIAAALIDSQRHQLSSAIIKPIVLVGKPGTGKTQYLRRLADLMAVPHLTLSVGGMSDNQTLKGSARSWSTARPSVISDFINENQCPNPVVILDEIEKGGQGRHNGNVYDTLLQLLEPLNASRFYDEYLQAPIDLSRVTFLATANSTEDLPEPIKDRVKVLKAPEPTADDRYLVAEQQWWSYWAARQIPMHEVPAFDHHGVKELLKENTSLRQVKKVMDVYLKHASADCPLMKLH